MSKLESELAACERLDLRGVRCPLNWAKARVRLEQLGRSAHLLLIVDDPRAVRDIPRAAEASGFHAGDVVEIGPGIWQLEILA